MKFSSMNYSRPNIDKFSKEYEKVLIAIENSQDFYEIKRNINIYFKLDDKLSTLSQLAFIRHSINTKDEFYEKEVNFLDESLPQIRKYSTKFGKILINSKFNKELRKEFGSTLFDSLELEQKTYKDEIVPLLQKENKLSTEYDKIIAGAIIEFQGKPYTLSQMSPFTQSKSRETRKEATLLVSKFFSENDEKIGLIYDELVKTRHQMALLLGYDNYIQLGYDNLGRTDYDANDVSIYRKQIVDDVLPVVVKLMEDKGKRLKIENLQSYDLNLNFLSGNPTPKGTEQELLAVAKNMYGEMSTETKIFFDYMMQNELMDLSSKPGKSSGGYCTFIPDYKTPFIFANFNETAHDVDVLTHEAGHAFQVYQSKDLIPAYRWPTYEAAEIHSMSMEFLAWPWVNGFFKEDTEKYKYTHLAGAVSFLPYGALVDNFQHVVYENPNMTWEERKTAWRDLEKKYMPYKNYDEDEFLSSGGFWYRQGHIFSSPFYYIDYTLAQVIAFSFWAESRKNYEKAWKKYLEICSLGGSYSFVKLLKETKLINPFKEGTIKKVMKPISEYLDSVDDLKL